MGKVSSSYKSLVRGVSQQVPEQRLPGQHKEQINVLSDPVRGLVRRQGTRMLRENPLPVVAGLAADLSTNFDEHDIKVEDDNYTLHTRRTGTSGPAAGVYPVVRGGVNDGMLVHTVASSDAQTLLGGGLNSITVVGRFVVMAHNQPTVVTEVPVWDDDLQKRRVNVYLRGGGYARTYKVRIKVAGVAEIVATYTSPTSSYPGVLNTADIPYTATDYVKQVNDRVNAYNSAVTQWIGTSAAAVQPGAIAGQIQALLTSAGLTTYSTMSRNGAIISIELIAGKSLEYVYVDDGGDGTQLKALWREVDSASDLPPNSWVGKTVKVAPTGQDGYYLTATSTGPSGGNVTWEEGVAEQAVLDNVFLIGAFESGSFYIGASPTDLMALVPTINVPAIEARAVGDADTSPVPHFAGRVINHVGTFQDRLLLTSGNVIAFSGIGDYFNFWRSTALTVLDDDTVEVYGNGSEDDTIKHGVFFDRGIVLFGDRQQYAIGGKVPLTPSTATVVQSSAHKDAAGVRPVALGEFVFYAKSESGYSRVYQISVGNIDDTSISSEITQQIDTYIRGSARALLGISMPNTLVVRSAGNKRGLYIFRYLDGGGERMLDAWSQWDFSKECGEIVGIAAWQDRLRITFIRDIGGVPHMVVDEASMIPGSNVLPHFDSMTTLRQRGGIRIGMQCAWGENPVQTRSWQGQEDGDFSALFNELGEDDLLRIGYPFKSSIDLTSPMLRDVNDAPVTIGRTVVNRLVLNYTKTGAFNVRVISAYEDRAALEYRGLQANAADALIGVRLLHSGRSTAAIGREVNQYIASIQSHQWQPMAITAVEWIGQTFNNIRRIT